MCLIIRMMSGNTSSRPPYLSSRIGILNSGKQISALPTTTKRWYHEIIVTTRIRRMGKVIFSQASVRSHLLGGEGKSHSADLGERVPSSQVRTGEGYPLPRSGLDGVPPINTGWGTSLLELDVGTPHWGWMGIPPYLDFIGIGRLGDRAATRWSEWLLLSCRRTILFRLCYSSIWGLTCYWYSLGSGLICCFLCFLSFRCGLTCTCCSSSCGLAGIIIPWISTHFPFSFPWL